MNLKKVPTIIFDLDGTITDFKSIDNRIINDLFKGSKIVQKIDKLAWKINSLDLLKNTTLMLKMRLILYSFLALKNVKKIIQVYENHYLYYTQKDLNIKFKQDIIKNIKAKGYHIIILSNNKMADKLFFENAEIASVRSKKKAIQNIRKECNIKYLIGNNLMDDYIPAKKYQINFLYVGKSKLFDILKIKRVKYLKSLQKKSGFP